MLAKIDNKVINFSTKYNNKSNNFSKPNKITIKNNNSIIKYNELTFISYDTKQIIKIDQSPFTRSKLLIYSLSKFYKKPNTLNKIIPIIKKQSHISLRLIEWVVMKKAKPDGKYNGLIFLINNKKYVHVHQDYQKHLKSFSGEYFGIFKRSDIIKLKYGKNKDDKIYTTVAQLNFFKWALEINLITFIENNFQKLASELYKSNKKSYLPTKITQNQDNNDIEITIEWN
jgi:hypothetical protein